MSILRISKDKENPYVMINKGVMKDEQLSWKARGLMGYLLSLPDDWIIHLSELEKHSSKDGRESLASGIKELIDLGYIVREQARKEDGNFGTWNYTVFESPRPLETTTHGKAESGVIDANGFHGNGVHDSVKPATTNTHTTNTDCTKKINNKKRKPLEKENSVPPKKGKYDNFYL